MQVTANQSKQRFSLMPPKHKIQVGQIDIEVSDEDEGLLFNDLDPAKVNENEDLVKLRNRSKSESKSVPQSFKHKLQETKKNSIKNAANNKKLADSSHDDLFQNKATSSSISANKHQNLKITNINIKALQEHKPQQPSKFISKKKYILLVKNVSQNKTPSQNLNIDTAKQPSSQINVKTVENGESMFGHTPLKSARRGEAKLITSPGAKDEDLSEQINEFLEGASKSQTSKRFKPRYDENGEVLQRTIVGKKSDFHEAMKKFKKERVLSFVEEKNDKKNRTSLKKDYTFSLVSQKSQANVLGPGDEKKMAKMYQENFLKFNDKDYSKVVRKLKDRLKRNQSDVYKSIYKTQEPTIMEDKYPTNEVPFKAKQDDSKQFRILSSFKSYQNKWNQQKNKFQKHILDQTSNKYTVEKRHAKMYNMSKNSQSILDQTEQHIRQKQELDALANAEFEEHLGVTTQLWYDSLREQEQVIDPTKNKDDQEPNQNEDCKSTLSFQRCISRKSYGKLPSNSGLYVTRGIPNNLNKTPSNAKMNAVFGRPCTGQHDRNRLRTFTSSNFGSPSHSNFNVTQLTNNYLTTNANVTSSMTQNMLPSTPGAYDRTRLSSTGTGFRLTSGGNFSTRVLESTQYFNKRRQIYGKKFQDQLNGMTGLDDLDEIQVIGQNQFQKEVDECQRIDEKDRVINLKCLNWDNELKSCNVQQDQVIAQHFNKLQYY